MVADVGHHDAYSVPLGILPACARLLTGLPAWFVGVRCPLGVVLEAAPRHVGRAPGRRAGAGADPPVAGGRARARDLRPGGRHLGAQSGGTAPP